MFHNKAIGTGHQHPFLLHANEVDTPIHPRLRAFSPHLPGLGIPSTASPDSPRLDPTWPHEQKTRKHENNEPTGWHNNTQDIAPAPASPPTPETISLGRGIDIKQADT